MKIKNKICILFLTGIYIFFIAIFNVKAENLSNYFNTSGFTDSNWYWNKYAIGIPHDSNTYYDLQHNIANIPTGTKTFSFNAYVMNHTDTESLSCWNSNNGVCTEYYDSTNFLMMSFSYQYQYCSMNFMSTSQNGTLYNVTCPVNNWYDGFLRFNVTNQGHNNMSIDFGIGTYVGFDISDNSQIASDTGDIRNKMNEDISQSDKDSPDQTQYNNAKQQEDNIIQSISNVSPNDITFSQDLQATNKIWDTTTRFLQTNAKVMGLVISILSIGIIKLIMNR